LALYVLKTEQAEQKVSALLSSIHPFLKEGHFTFRGFWATRKRKVFPRSGQLQKVAGHIKWIHSMKAAATSSHWDSLLSCTMYH